MFKTVCTTMTPDTVKLFSGNATGKLLFGVARCDNVLYVFWVFLSNFLWFAPCGWSGLVAWALFWWPRFGVLWLPWGSPLACSPQPWAETRWRRVRLSWLVAAMGAPPGPRGGRSPTNRRLFRQLVQYIKNA